MNSYTFTFRPNVTEEQKMQVSKIAGFYHEPGKESITVTDRDRSFRIMETGFVYEPKVHNIMY